MTVLVRGLPVIRDAREAVAALQNDTVIGFDTETTGLSPWRNKLAVLQFYGEQSGTTAVIQVKNGVVPQELKDLFTPDRLFICHNGVSFDIPFLATHDVPWQNAKWYDSLVGETVCISTGRKDVRKSLAASTARRLGVTIDKGIAHGHWHEELTDLQVTYAADDVINLPALRQTQLERAEETRQTGAMELEQAIVPYVALMTINGLPCRKDKMFEYIAQQQAEVGRQYSNMVATFGNINFNSHVQIKQAVKRLYGLTWESTAAAALTDMVFDDVDSGPLAQLILDYRAPVQRLKMYNDEFIEQHIINDTIHARFWQCSADTGRFTCSDPNLQQVPRDGRWVFGNKPGHKVVAVDYSQIEMRVAAYISGDEHLLQALDDEDIHTSVASMIFRVPMDQVAKEQRRKAKAAGFALLYCGGIPRLYNQARSDGSPMTMEEAEQVFYAFFKRFDGLWRMRNKAIQLSKTNRMNTIRMPSGLRRVLVGVDNRPSTILNSSVQGFAAAGLKKGMLEAGGQGLFQYIGAQVHDELVATVPDAEAEDFGQALSAAMIKGMKTYLPVTVKAEAKIGDTWK